jgi:hypothetical protein
MNEHSVNSHIDPRLEAPFDYEEFFTSSKLDGQKIEILHIGKLSLPSGRIIS